MAAAKPKKPKLTWEPDGEPWAAPPPPPLALSKSYITLAFGPTLAVGVTIDDYVFHVTAVARAAPDAVLRSIPLGGSHAAAKVPERIAPVRLSLSADESRVLVYGAHAGRHLALDVSLDGSGAVHEVLPGGTLTAATHVGADHVAALDKGNPMRDEKSALLLFKRGADGALTQVASAAKVGGHSLHATGELIAAVDKKLLVFARSGDALEALGSVALPGKKTWGYRGKEHLGAHNQTESHRLVVTRPT